MIHKQSDNQALDEKEQWVYKYLQDNFPSAWPLAKLEGMARDIVKYTQDPSP